MICTVIGGTALPGPYDCGLAAEWCSEGRPGATGAGLTIEDFFAFQAEESVRKIYRNAVDPAYAERELPPGIGVAVPAGLFAARLPSDLLRAEIVG
jgi:hypothetical protein